MNPGGVVQAGVRQRHAAEPQGGVGASGLSALMLLLLLGPEVQHAGLQVQAVTPALPQGVLPLLLLTVIGNGLGQGDAERLGGRL